MKVTGKVHFVGQVKQVSDKFKSKDVVILTDEKYPQYISIQFTQDKTELVSQEDMGDQVEVSINLRGREWKSPNGEIKYFNTLEGWQINTAERANEIASERLADLPQAPLRLDDDDLPF
jgi:single-strand DNA-binding protein